MRCLSIPGRLLAAVCAAIAIAPQTAAPPRSAVRIPAARPTAEPAGSPAPTGPLRDSVRITVQLPRRIVTDGGAGGYQAFPDICRLRSGELLCVFYAGYGHISQPNAEHPRGGRVCAVRSSDDGKTWSAPTVVIDTERDDRDPSVCCLPDGALLCNFFTYGRFGECDTCVVRSRDGGHTWSAPEIVAPSFATSSPIRRLRSGRLLLIVYNVDGGGKRSYPAVCVSDDRGRNWSSPHPIAENSGKTLDETDIFERRDGTLLAVMRQVMCSSESRDGGKSWSEPRDLGFPGHCPYLLQTSDGVLLLGHRLPETSLHYSLDEGRTWQGPVLIDHVIGAYPSMVPLRDGSILCVYYEEGPSSAIRAARIRVDRNGRAD
ncbi:MAG TPA: sialidase family protein [Chthonomonadaceae bacterium]|nr:sialidase family protein [Chthonomonadaceae bacterium]